MVSKKFLVGIAALFCAASVHAAPVALSSSLSLDNYLTTGLSQNLQVDVNSLLAGSGLSSASIISGSLTVFGYSAADYGLTSSVKQLNYSVDRTTTDCNKQGKCKVVKDNFHVKQFNAKYSDNVVDQMEVRTGATSGSDSVDEHLVSNTDSGQIEDKKKRTGSENGGYNYFYNQDINQYDAYRGDLSVELNLDALALNDLVADGILNLTIKSLLGQFNITDVRLDFVAQEAVPPADVPVPTSLLLTGLGLIALATVRRRKA